MCDMRYCFDKFPVLGLSVLAAGLLFSGCAKEPQFRLPTDGEVTLLLRPEMSEEIVVKSFSQDNIDENGIKNLWVIQMTSDGHVVLDDNDSPLITQYPYSGSDGKGQISPAADGLGASIKMRLDPATSKVCFIANTAQSYAVVYNEEDIYNIQAVISSEDALAYVQNSTAYLPMSGVWNVSTAGSSNEVEMLRSVAKLDLTLAFAPGDDGDRFALNSIRVMQAANVLHPYRNPDEVTATGPYPKLTGTTNYTALLYDGSADSQEEAVDLRNEWSESAKYMPSGADCFGKPILNGTGNLQFTWYLPENVRGKGTATKQWEKTADTAPEGAEEYCTYLEIKGYYLHDGLVENVVYHVYLGENNTDDFNIRRNHNYQMTATIKDKKLVDTRIDGYDPVNYVDYTDNDSPWFVGAASDDGSQNWQNPSAEEGWSVPTQKQMMLAWVYNSDHIFGNSICWLDDLSVSDDGTTKKRWSINMDIGEVLLNDGSGESVQSYVVRAVKDYNGSYKYPYVSGDNIIVSRDENGGAKEDYIRMVEEESWTATPPHDERDPLNKVASKLEVSKFATDAGQWVRRDWDKAHDYCQGLEEDGKTDWRMPTQRELMLLYIMNDQLSDAYKLRTGKDEQGFNPDNNDKHPELGQHIYYWSGTEDRTASGEETETAWSVCFCTDLNPGKTEGYGKVNENFVRCVRDYIGDTTPNAQ